MWDYWEGTVKLHRATAQTLCLQRQHFGRQEAVTGGTETQVYAVPGMLYIGAGGKLCYICYPEHRKAALIWVKGLNLTHSWIFRNGNFWKYFGTCLPISTRVVVYECVVYRAKLTKYFNFNFSQTEDAMPNKKITLSN